MALHEVRAAEPADADAIAAVYAPYVLQTAVSFEEEPPHPDEIRQRMVQEPRLPWLAAERAGQVVGYCYASPHHQRAAYRWSVDCAVYLAAEEHGRGTAGALYAALLGELRGLGYVTAFAGISLPNDASVALHERFGFHLIGVHRRTGYKQGAWRDVGWWQLGLRDPPAAPDEPRQWTPG